MTTTLIQNVRALAPGHGLVADKILLRDGQIAAVSSAVPPDATVERIDGGGRLLTPGLVDVHTHGLHAYHYEHDPQHLVAGLDLAPRYGTTSVLPTLYATLQQGSLDKIAALAAALTDSQYTRVPGFHMEGPFLALTGAGGATLPADIGYLDELLAAADGRVAAMSVSPEVPGIIPLIERLRERNISVFVTHTQASVEQTLTAVAAGATHATHFYAVFPAPPEYDPGVRTVAAAEVYLADPRCTVDFIGDGIHAHPIVIKLALAAKGWDKVILVSDSNIGAGLPAGIYDTPWGFQVKVSAETAARIHDPGGERDGMLAGSALTMNRGMSNLLSWLDAPPEHVWAMGTRNPARLIGRTDLGTLAVGAAADLVLWDDDLSPHRSWINGQTVYQRDAAENAGAKEKP